MPEIGLTRTLYIPSCMHLDWTEPLYPLWGCDRCGGYWEIWTEKDLDWAVSHTCEPDVG